MKRGGWNVWRRSIGEYGIVLVLLALGLFFSVATYKEQFPVGASAGNQVAERAYRDHGTAARVAVLAVSSDEGDAFVAGATERLAEFGVTPVVTLQGGPPLLREGLEQPAIAADGLDAILCTETLSRQRFIRRLRERVPAFRATAVVTPTSYAWPDFLKGANVRAVANRIAVIAIIAIGMTMVIITAGIDLSVGSMIAFSAVVVAWLIRAAGEPAVTVPLPTTLAVAWHLTVGLAMCVFGIVWWWDGRRATALFTIGTSLTLPYVAWLATTLLARGIPRIGNGPAGMVACSLLTVVLCGAMGGFSGVMVAFFAIPPFIVTLALMLIASGMAYLIAQNESIYQLPVEFTHLGRGFWWGIPNAVLLMILLYVVAHMVMTRTVLGRYIYAVGGNPEAARLSGVPVRRVILFCYGICGALAGVGGIIRASELKSGAPTYGLMAELDVIAAVVVGGTSLAGGEGKIWGTLVGALIIGVIRNGMNLTNVESNEQKVVLGLVILGAVLLDLLKKQNWRSRPSAQSDSDRDG